MTWEAQCAGAASSLLFVLLNCAMNIYTKWLFSAGGGNFPLPWTMLAVQQIESYVVLQLLLAVKDPTGRFGWIKTRGTTEAASVVLVPGEEERQEEILGLVEMMQVFAVTGLFCLNVGLNSLSLVRISITLNQTVRAFLPVGVLLLGTCIERRAYPSHSYFTTIFLVIGIALTCWGSPDFDMLGFNLALMSTLVGAAGTSLNGRLLSVGPFRGTGSVNIMRLMMLQSLPAFFVFSVVAAFTERDALSKHLVDPEAGGWLHILALVSVSSALALVSNLGRCFLVASTSALMETFAGNTKVAALCVIDERLFGTRMYSYNYVGVALTFFGFSVHVLLQYLAGAKQDSKQAKEAKAARTSGREGLNEELERLKTEDLSEKPMTGSLSKVSSSQSVFILNMPRLISGAETGLFSEHLALRLGREHPFKRRKGRKNTNLRLQLSQVAEDGEEGEVPPLTRPRSRTWQAGEDTNKTWLGDLNPVLEAPDWLNDASSLSSDRTHVTSMTSPETRSSPSGIPVIDRAVSRNRFNSDLV